MPCSSDPKNADAPDINADDLTPAQARKLVKRALELFLDLTAVGTIGQLLNSWRTLEEKLDGPWEDEDEHTDPDYEEVAGFLSQAGLGDIEWAAEDVTGILGEQDIPGAVVEIRRFLSLAFPA